jgi:hypothetical protein
VLLVSCFIKRLSRNLEAYLYTAATITYAYYNYTETHFYHSTLQKRLQYISLLFSVSSPVLLSLIVFVLGFFTSIYIYIYILIIFYFNLDCWYCVCSEFFTLFCSLVNSFNNSFKHLHLVPVPLGMLDVSLFHSCPHIFIYL